MEQNVLFTMYPIGTQELFSKQPPLQIGELPPPPPPLELLNPEPLPPPDPEVLFVIDRTAATSGKESTVEKDIQNDIIKQTTAYKNNQIVYLDGPLWYLSGGGLQSELAKIEEVLAELK